MSDTLIQQLKQIINKEIQGESARAILIETIKEYDRFQELFIELNQLTAQAESTLIYGVSERPGNLQLFS